jgi:membrane-associated phospholipid phosphatase
MSGIAFVDETASLLGTGRGKLEDISINKALRMPLLLTVATVGLAGAISFHTGVSGWRVFFPYLSAWAAVSLLAILIWMFVEVAKMAPTGAARPLQTVFAGLRRPTELIVLPGLIFPIFLGGYTWAKCSIPFAVGYGWEKTWADADHLLFGMDAWRWAHAIFPASTAQAWTFFYAVIWGFALVFSGALVSVFASRRFVATFFTAMMMSWLIGGIAMAYALSAAGPVFAHLADPALADRFLPLREHLAGILPADNMVSITQRYLAAGMDVKIALKGGGVSAMPSMHIATASIFLVAARRTRWVTLALLFLALTLLGSVYLGYHYAVDAPVAAIVAVICWLATSRLYRRPAACVEQEGALNLARQPAS